MSNQRKPNNLHLLEGTFRKHRHGDPNKKIKVGAEFPVQPKWLPKDAKAEWQRIKKVMEKSSVIISSDASTLAQYCLLFSEMKKLKENFPAAKHTQLRSCASELGLTPVARSKIAVPKDDDEEF